MHGSSLYVCVCVYRCICMDQVYMYKRVFIGVTSVARNVEVGGPT